VEADDQADNTSEHGACDRSDGSAPLDRHATQRQEDRLHPVHDRSPTDLSWSYAGDGPNDVS
jgi:hypothetical protein